MKHNSLCITLCCQLGIEWPLIQAPLGGEPSTPELVAAVSNTGVLGSLGAAYLSPDDLEHAIQRIRNLTSRPYGINLFAPTPTPRLPKKQIEAAFVATRSARHELAIPDPVVAAPFMDGNGIAAALLLGAQAAQLRTAFLLCDEAGTSSPYIPVAFHC